MRANLPEREPEVYAAWQRDKIWERMSQRLDGCDTFTLHDGPPYANGDIHLGHALNKILKDFIVKHHYFNGKKVHWTPGWDCHGLPIENKAIAGNAFATPSSIRLMCRKVARESMQSQSLQFQQLGITADWDNPYSTMSHDMEADTFARLVRLTKNGLIYEREKPVYWSWKEETALAEAEVEHRLHKSRAAYVAMDIDGDDFSGAKIVVWTTTPWTLPANVAIALNPNEKYVLTEERYIVAEKCLERLTAASPMVSGKTVNTFDPSCLKDAVIKNPLRSETWCHDILNNANLLAGDNFASVVVFDDMVDMETGSGCVHIAPGHGEIDHQIAVKNKLPIVMPVDEKGCYTEEIEDIVGQPPAFEHSLTGTHVFNANQPILDYLAELNALLSDDEIEHMYPYCERSLTPLIFRATNQWFIPIAKLRKTAMEMIEDVEFEPESGKEELKHMVANRPDWCISRQRNWGVPIAFFRHKKSGRILLNEKVLEKTNSLIRKHGSDCWIDMPTETFIGNDCKYKPDELEKITDVLDVWFDSGSTPGILGPNSNSGDYPADVFLEGRDQYRGWFSSTLWLAAADVHSDRNRSKVAPYKKIVCHGFVNDGEGRKMAKRSGKAMKPEEILKKHGAEVLRMWVAMQDYTSDLRLSNEILVGVTSEYKKIRNTFKFLLSNLGDFELTFLNTMFCDNFDWWILNKANKVFSEVHELFEQCKFSKGMHLLMEFIHHDLSGIYLSAIKDKMYCNLHNSLDRRGSQTAMYYVLRSMTGLLAPITTFTCDEVYKHAPEFMRKNSLNQGKDIFDLPFQLPPTKESDFNEEFHKKLKTGLHELVAKLKDDGVMRDTLELAVNQPDSPFHKHCVLTADVLGVSHYYEAEDKLETPIGEFEIDGTKYFVHKSPDVKCPRCWKYTVPLVRTIEEGDEDVCERCKESIKETTDA